MPEAPVRCGSLAGETVFSQAQHHSEAKAAPGTVLKDPIVWVLSLVPNPLQLTPYASA